ncbi:hypothetical protein EIP91_008591 [Steccherinum ochraceum]|uniref:RGS domain-containing protein n=1 Tax=Steccherinum ochraceum TaxID=92696 RepID=A0A4R0R2M3_9APHY|nr:hypothetical protein EIP91_008591 [Steccherinum ochraceum]
MPQWLVRWLEPSPLTSITLDEIISGHTCDPIALADFEAYLQHKEHTVENLQFVIWYQSYRGRFFDLPLAEQALSPGPTNFKFNAPDAARLDRRVRDSERMYEVLDMKIGGRVQPNVRANRSDKAISPITPISPSSYLSSSSDALDYMTSPLPKKQPQEYLGSFQPLHREYLDSQPLRKECSAVLQTFIVSGSPKELSLSDEMRQMVMRDVTWNTHPDVFLPVYEQIYDILSTQSLPQFLKLSATNVNLPKAMYWYTFGIAYMIFSLVILIPLVMLGPGGVHKRAWRCFSIPFSSLGLMQIYSGWKGLCTEVWSRGRAQLRPWDLQLLEEENAQIGSSQASDARRYADEEHGLSRPAFEATAHSSSTLSVHPHDDKTRINSTTASKSSGSMVDRAAHLPISLSTSGLANTTTPAIADQTRHNMDHFPFEEPRQIVEITAKPRMFGPERPLLDPRIRRVHALIVRDMAIVGVIWTTVWVAIICCVPNKD